MLAEEVSNLTLEETFEKIDEVMEKLNDDTVSLEESFELYKNGMDMLKKCRDTIDEVEKKVCLLNGSDEGEE